MGTSRLLRFLERNPLSSKGSKLETHATGFHGDEYLLRFVDVVMPKMRNFVETGSNVGNTLSYVALRYAGVDCFSCEPDAGPRAIAAARLPQGRAWVSPLRSQDFLPALLERKPTIADEPTFIWLDAHGGGFRWPLTDEMRFVFMHLRRFVVVVDDFKVPGRPDFGFDRYRGQVCSHAYIRPHVMRRTERLHYPTYSERTSTRHGLRGWGVYSRWEGDAWDPGIDFLREADWGHPDD